MSANFQKYGSNGKNKTKHEVWQCSELRARGTFGFVLFTILSHPIPLLPRVLSRPSEENLLS